MSLSRRQFIKASGVALCAGANARVLLAGNEFPFSFVSMSWS
ncbi:hypothetical protein C0U44_12765 [Klebsiella pneumoniae]|nr:hypothetical protein C0U44_12765 [Klebsiella pneumoniae]